MSDKAISGTDSRENDRLLDDLLRCLENDWHISASWDGLRRFWCIELTEEGVRIRDAAPTAATDVLRAIDQLRRDLSGYHGQLKAHDDLQRHCDNQRRRIAELEGLYAKAKAENEKLRELLRDMWCNGFTDDTPFDVEERVYIQMEELGISTEIR